jgi:hypothetical protein
MILLSGKVDLSNNVTLPIPKPAYKPTEQELASMVGNYYSNELQMTYQAFIKEGKLFVQYKPYKPVFDEAFVAQNKDSFTSNGYNITFVRNEKGEVTHFNLGGGRMGVMKFEKR